ncbi:Sad1 and UNC84 domain containing 1, transcript variant X5 [Ictidomys tridecemlineatus]|uniref:SUN domain-containing protein 1 isoform X9 n=1 Tax=Ictidomys tridecemlineatus TaxID=43179 RepID=UPI00068171E3|nr:SUN domain-containing protein 1 isoform X9 [Ictidomys tridecemlineatus]KAG3260152.1 Sad1 and UNC84 domain containing 1, transcript variant X5 [Ictidomys tridecemlineatus]
MDFSRLHTYTPPQCVPENTGYTYALSSSYSSDALDFEIEHKLDPVFDSPRMSRRSLRLVTTTYSSGDGQAVDLHSCTSRAASLQSGAARTAKQRRSASKPAFSINHLSGKATSSGTSQGSSRNLRSTTAPRPPVLDESLIREQTKVDHFWGLDDDGDLKGGTKAATQGNGDLATDATTHNGYICRDCSMLSQRTEALTAHPASQGPSSRVYSRDRNPKPHRSYLGRMAVRELSREDGHTSVHGESQCDDCKEKKHLETHTATHLQLSRPRRVAGAVGRLFTHAGHFLVQMLRRVGAAGWLVSETVRSVLWLAVVAPGKAASGMLWWLGIGWYQFVTLISWLNVFLLTRCLRNICKFLILLIPLLLLLGAGISLWGQGDFLSLLPILNWTNVHSAHRTNDPKDMFRPGASYLNQPLQADDRASQWHQESDMGHQVASLTAQCHNHDQKLKELTVLLQKLQVRVNQMDDGREGLSSWVKDTVRLHLREMGLAGLPSTETNIVTFNHDHEVRLSNLEDILGKLRETSEAIQKELEHIKQRTISGAEEQPLLPRIQRLELELGLLRTQLSDWQHQKASCEEVDTQVRETIKLLFSEDQQGGSLEWLLQKFSSQFVSKDDLQVLLQDLELQVLKNITHHITVTGQAPTSEAVVSAMSNAGVSGITEEQVRVLVNKALKLYSQDKTGMVDFALESGGGSILSTRCSETYETKTALLSLFGIPLWYFSQSPRVVIQPDIYPGNCWAFKGSQGYLVVRLSMKIHPTIFTVEHIPKTLSPTGNISSAPKDFAVYGLENEYQEEGQPLGQFTYDQEGESLQMFHAPERPDKAFQILELRILSNWGHPEYTCLYRFRVHGEPAK